MEMRAVGSDEPVTIAWNIRKKSEEHSNSRHWLAKQGNSEAIADGALWAAFVAGFEAATTQAVTAPSAPAGTPESETRERTFDPNGWQPIDSAPKDGTAIWGGHWERGMHANDMAFAEVVWFARGKWRSNLDDFTPDFWLPLKEPPPPKRDGTFEQTQPAPEPDARVLSEAEMDAIEVRAQRLAQAADARSGSYHRAPLTLEVHSVLTLLAMARRAPK